MTPPTRNRSRRYQQGFTLPELLVSLTILGVVLSQLLLLLVAQNRIYAARAQSLNAQGDGLLVMEMILRDVRVAGFLVSPNVGLSSVDGGALGADILCASDSNVMDEATIATASANYERATLTSALGAGVTSVVLNTTSMDIDSNGSSDFAVGGGLIISDGTGTHCARIIGITNGAATTVTFAPATPAGFDAALGATRAVPAFVYEVTDDGLWRNDVLLSPLVENLQIEFGVDADDSGELEPGEFPTHSLDAADPSQVTMVRLSVITRTQRSDPDVLGGGMAAAANHTGSAPDGFVRRRLTATLVPRNLRK